MENGFILVFFIAFVWLWFVAGQWHAARIESDNPPSLLLFLFLVVAFVCTIPLSVGYAFTMGRMRQRLKRQGRLSWRYFRRPRILWRTGG